MSLSQEELQYIASQVKVYVMDQIRSSSTKLDKIEVIEDLSGVTSMPVYDSTGGQKKLVRVAISVLQQPALDAAATVHDTILASKTATKESIDATAAAKTATNDANKAAENAETQADRAKNLSDRFKEPMSQEDYDNLGDNYEKDVFYFTFEED